MIDRQHRKLGDLDPRAGRIGSRLGSRAAMWLAGRCGPVFMAKLPSGTVTFLFTDIVGSTHLVRRLHGRYAELLADHHTILRRAFAEHDGHEVSVQGDGFFVAFSRARDAIDAAVAGQRWLALHAWPEDLQVRVRMGLHTGEATVQFDDYVGLDVHRASRICSVAHGASVLLSRATRELVRDDLPQSLICRDLGVHRLKDLERPERLFQILAPSEGLRLCAGHPTVTPTRPVQSGRGLRTTSDVLPLGDLAWQSAGAA
jgi:class 3 adenylate cyclase